MGNRVEDLEKQVAELQATIDGLTEELVETKERVRQLEDGEDAPATSTTTTTTTTEADGGDRRENQHAEFVPNADRSQDVAPEADADDGEEGWREASDEAADEESAAANEVKGADGDESNEDGDAEDDGDIIVA